MFRRELRTPVDLAFGSPPCTDLPGGPGMEYLHSLRQRLTEVHDFACRRQDQAGEKQKWAYDVHCRGQPFLPGEKV